MEQETENSYRTASGQNGHKNTSKGNFCRCKHFSGKRCSDWSAWFVEVDN